MAEFADKTLEKRSVPDLIQMAKLSKTERSERLHETLKVGLARCAMRLSEMPFGFCHAGSIRRVTAAYVENFRQVLDFEHNQGIKGLTSQEYHELTQTIFNGHRGTMLDVAKGVFEFNEDLNALFGEGLELAEIRQDLSLIQDIESSLDEFFTHRLTLRLLISHVSTLNNAQQGGDSGGRASEDMVGVVKTNTQPIAILSRAYNAARFMCLRDFQMAPELLVNGELHEEFLLRDVSTQQHFPYVHTHLFYIFLELVKNAARATIERAQMEAAAGPPGRKPLLPAIQITVPEEQATWDKARCVKLADRGSGMNRKVLSKAFCYFFSSVKARPMVADEVSDFDRRVPLA
eukprot:CAMPEP_0195107920 /NCGR_PEP_ID=MMETSP0448-20130528/82785_1 /TAXON_ID=66468 /ORGANISM="Heterocapsa triquestra, Strain CCMP 448" /LENGTH=346 /DNA_ID=CAMNT_0040144407 /DNA_START=25 /DNA_END=1061 /DNA_ORIENTATION=-